MNTQVWLQNSFRLAGQVNSEPLGSMRNTTNDRRSLCNFHDSVKNTKSKHLLRCLTFCLFPEYVHAALSTTQSSQATPCENRKIFQSM